ncbi:MAG: type II toxin-antitoxin system VapC family toxin [Bryobacteraceae bacterium]
MRRVLLDTNVILDVLLDRSPHAAASSAVWAAVEAGQAEGLLAAHAVTMIHYLIERELGPAKARRMMTNLLRVFGVAAVDGTVIQEALEISAPDFEDAVAASAARRAECELIVTRDPRRFKDSPIRVLTPEAALPLLA